MQGNQVLYLLLIVFWSATLLSACVSSEQLADPVAYFKKERRQQPSPTAALPVMDSVVMTGSRSKIRVTYSHPDPPPAYGWRSGTIVQLQECDLQLSQLNCNPLQLKYADKLGIEPYEIENFCLYNFIEDWYGVRYRMGGTDKKGIDCSAFVQLLYGNVYCVDVVRTSLEQFRNCHFIRSKDSLQEGNLVFFRTRGRKRINHVGIYLSNNYFVHASSSLGVVISNLDDTYWSRSFAGAGVIM